MAPGDTLVLPRGGEATLVLHDVGGLVGDEQTRILRWLDESHGRIRIVSTNTQPLWPRVTSGAFDETLYYRLNTVHVDVSGLRGSERSRLLTQPTNMTRGGLRDQISLVDRPEP